jgi:hypothetical protein
VQDGPTIFQGVKWCQVTQVLKYLLSLAEDLKPIAPMHLEKCDLTSHSDLFKDASVLKNVGNLVFEFQEHAQHDILANLYDVVRLDQVNSSSIALLE